MRNYEAPAIVEIGDFTELTQASNSGNYHDQLLLNYKQWIFSAAEVSGN